MSLHSVDITVRVFDRAALWRKARDYLISNGERSFRSIIGSERKPDVKACLIMLLDRSEHLDGAEIGHSTVEDFGDGDDGIPF